MQHTIVHTHHKIQSSDNPNAIASHITSHCSTVGANGETLHIAVTTEETHQSIVSGPEESHTIHQLRATTVIFEEGGDDEDIAVANIVLPIRPHHGAVRVEEVGSYRLETHDVTQRPTINSGIVDEIDSDVSGQHSKSISRNVSIVSAHSDQTDEILESSSRDVLVQEQRHTIDLGDDGEANVHLKTTIIDEEQVFSVNDNSNDNDHLKKQSIDMNELNPTEQRQTRIKEMRAQARKASLITRESIEEISVPMKNTQSTRSAADDAAATLSTARLFDELLDGEEDEAVMKLLQRGAAQRAALDEILNGDQKAELSAGGCKDASGTRFSFHPFRDQLATTTSTQYPIRFEYYTNSHIRLLFVENIKILMYLMYLPTNNCTSSVVSGAFFSMCVWLEIIIVDSVVPICGFVVLHVYVNVICVCVFFIWLCGYACDA